jgi:hypothetical protein
MKWIKPQHGDRRVKRKFAWWPVTTNLPEGGKLVLWWEHYYSCEEYSDYMNCWKSVYRTQDESLIDYSFKTNFFA